MTMNDLTIVINTFNSDEKIYSCLNSIKQEFKILIVENSDNHRFKETIEKKYPNVLCELTGENLGYAKGNNLGLSKVKSKFALVLNPDTLLEKNTIDNFLRDVTEEINNPTPHPTPNPNPIINSEDNDLQRAIELSLQDME